ncbi:MAG: hypothetical protein MUF00_01485 [Gemmatimonadaceae bacterium]|nr:hypothetical protein [Gemmatimonadaceae bacterium]
MSSDLEHLVSLADMHGAHVRLRKHSRKRVWTASVVTDGRHELLATSTEPTITAAVLACLAKLRAKETTDGVVHGRDEPGGG